MKLKVISIVLLFSMMGCATGRDMTSDRYIPEWENNVINLPAPSDTSAGYWAAEAAGKTAGAVERIILLPFAVLGNIVVHAYLIPTWPLRYLFQGDKRLIVWTPLFGVGEEVHSDYYSKTWNRDLI